MSRDYKNSGRSKAPEKPAAPGFLWFVTGLSIGLLVALLIYLNEHQPQRIEGKSKPVAERKSQQRKTATQTKNTEQKLEFEFYTLLPKSEVIISEEQLHAEQAPGKDAPSSPQAKSSYMLQAGSFRQRIEAEKFKGELALLGVVATIQAGTVHQDDWYRVRVGPIQSLREINRIRNRLLAHEINTILLKIKD